MSDLAIDREHRVSPVEQFFDLVFAFAFAQVTALWLQQPSWGGFARGLLALAVLWWVWASYAWLTNRRGCRGGSRVGCAARRDGFVAAPGRARGFRSGSARTRSEPRRLSAGRQPP